MLNGMSFQVYSGRVQTVKLRKSASSLSVAKGSLDVADLKFDIDGNVNYSILHP
ncbi:MAG: hypothetical protein MZV63_71125 [Marinilabiliales bacterium]|nr:hypothetical protein [Marinilabiliales bacterium]